MPDIETKICYVNSPPYYDFGPCPDDQMNWGGHVKSKCEMVANVGYEPLLTIGSITKGSKSPDDYRVHPTHLGDPKRGAVVMNDLMPI